MKTPSRQYAQQLAWKAAGLCVSCGEERGKSAVYCDKHLLHRRKKQRDRRGYKPKVEGGVGRPVIG